MNELKNFQVRWLAESLLHEGVYDPAIFKAFFLAGSAGSGKGYVGGATLGGHGLITVNSDAAFEHALQKAGLSMKLEDEPEEAWQPLRARAKEVTLHKHANLVNERLGIVLDSTGDSYGKIQNQKHALDSVGYDCYMIFVNTSLDVALARNKKRARSIDNEVAEKMWHQVQANKNHFQSLFGNHFIEVHNNNPSQDDLALAAKWVRGYVNKPVTNPIALKWIHDQLGGAGRAPSTSGNHNANRSFDTGANPRSMGEAAKEPIRLTTHSGDVIVLSPKKTPDGEYVVKVMRGGKNYEPAAYYTDDWDDAVATAKHMGSR